MVVFGFDVIDFMGIQNYEILAQIVSAHDNHTINLNPTKHKLKISETSYTNTIIRNQE